MSAVAARVGNDSWRVDGLGAWNLAQLVADLCEDRGGVRTLISQLHLRDEDLFNAGEHAPTPPRLSATCLAEMGRAGVSRGTAVVADDRETLAVYPRSGWPEPVLVELGGDRIEVGRGFLDLLRLAPWEDPASATRFRLVGTLGALFAQAPTPQGNAVLLPVFGGMDVLFDPDIAEAAVRAAAGRAEAADDVTELAAWQEAHRDPQWREHAGEKVEPLKAAGMVSRAVVRCRDGSPARTVRVVDHDLPCSGRYPGMWRQLEQVFAASARTGLPVRWEAVGRGA
jgi:hypothetical protein